MVAHVKKVETGHINLVPRFLFVTILAGRSADIVNRSLNIVNKTLGTRLPGTSHEFSGIFIIISL